MDPEEVSRTRRAVAKDEPTREELIEHFRALGMSANEARVYAAIALGEGDVVEVPSTKPEP